MTDDERIVNVKIGEMIYEKRMYRKSPTLLELLRKLELEVVGELHNSMNDVRCCMEAYKKLKKEKK